MRRNIEIESRIRAALKRLKLKRPNHVDLKERVRLGRRLINVSTVALEASVSRTLIGHDGCSYPELRKEILKATAEERPSPSATQLTSSLRAKIRDLKVQIEMKDTYIAELLLEIQRLGGSTNSASGNIVNFRRQNPQRHRQ